MTGYNEVPASPMSINLAIRRFGIEAAPTEFTEAKTVVARELSGLYHTVATAAARIYPSDVDARRAITRRVGLVVLEHCAAYGNDKVNAWIPTTTADREFDHRHWLEHIGERLVPITEYLVMESLLAQLARAHDARERLTSVAHADFEKHRFDATTLLIAQISELRQPEHLTSTQVAYTTWTVAKRNTLRQPLNTGDVPVTQLAGLNKTSPGTISSKVAQRNTTLKNLAATGAIDPDRLIDNRPYCAPIDLCRSL